MDINNKDKNVKSAENQHKNKFVKIPQTGKVILLNSALVLGMTLLAVGFMVVASYAIFGHVYFPPLTCALFLAGIVFFLLVFGVSQNGFLLFLGINFIIGAVVMFFYLVEAIPLKWWQLWPLFAVSSGISLFMVGLYRYRKIKSKYLFPSITLVVLGSFFFLFSAKIIKTSFKLWFLQAWPFFAIAAGLALIIIFIFQQKRQHLFPMLSDDDDDSDDDVFDSQAAEKLLKKNDGDEANEE